MVEPAGSSLGEGSGPSGAYEAVGLRHGGGALVDGAGVGAGVPGGAGSSVGE